MSNDVKLAVVGLGLVGKRHVEAIRQSGAAELCAIVEPTGAGKNDAATMGVPCLDTLEELFRSTKTDGVILSTPTPLHLEQGLLCIENKCPVLIEKPLAVTAEDGRKIVSAAIESDVPVLVGHHRRHNPLIRKARKLIEAGELGAIRAVHANCWFYKPDDYYEIAPWRKLKGAGPVSVNLVHDVDLLRYLCGEITEVQAQAAPSARGFENEDVASALLRFENGAIGTITVSDAIVSPWSWELTSREYPIYPVTSEFCYLVGGSEASLSVPDLKLWSHGERPDWWSPISATSMPREASDPLINQIKHFSDVIKGEEAPLVSADEGYKTLRVIEAIQIAATNAEKIDLSA